MTIAGEVFLAVLNSLWQAAIVAGLVWLALRFLRGINAATRYAVWWAALAVVIALPVAPSVIAWSRARMRQAQLTTQAPRATAPLTQPLIEDTPAIVTLPEERASRWPLWIAGLWTALCLYRLWQIGRSYWYLRGVKARAKSAGASVQPLPRLKRRARLLISRDVASPMAVGFLHPAVILPESLPGELEPSEMEHILLHESAHLARSDDWSNLLARLLGAALAPHPVAWWILRQIEREREIACDDWVVARVGSARPYARSLARMSELRWSRKAAPGIEQGEALASGILGGGSRLGERIEALLKRQLQTPVRISRFRVAVSAGALCACCAATAFAPRMVAFAQERPAFEVASVRPTPPGPPNPGRARLSDGTTVQQRSSGTFSYSDQALQEYVKFAYGLKNYQLVQPRGNLQQFEPLRQFYDIDAKASGPVTDQQARLMFQTLLEVRFKLKLHRETKEMEVWALVVTKGGPKFHEGANDGTVAGAHLSPNGIAWHNISMDYLAEWITPFPSLGRVVIDRTGLSGLYDLTLSFENPANGDDPVALKRGLRDGLDASIFTSLQDIGLKLESAKAPIDYYSVDHVEPPDAN